MAQPEEVLITRAQELWRDPEGDARWLVVWAEQQRDGALVLRAQRHPTDKDAEAHVAELAIRPHWPHVVVRFASLIRDCGSHDGLTSWYPWQLAQLATRRSPSAPANP